MLLELSAAMVHRIQLGCVARLPLQGQLPWGSGEVADERTAMDGQTVPDYQQRPAHIRIRCCKNSMICSPLMLPGKSLKQKFHHAIPAMTDGVFHRSGIRAPASASAAPKPAPGRAVCSIRFH